MTKKKYGRHAVKGKQKFTDQLKDQIYSNGAVISQSIFKVEGLPYPVGNIGEGIDSVIETLDCRLALAEWCLRTGRGKTVYARGLKELGL